MLHTFKGSEPYLYFLWVANFLSTLTFSVILFIFNIKVYFISFYNDSRRLIF